MNICIKCKNKLKSSKNNAKVCSKCNSLKLESVSKTCIFCSQDFIDNSRSKNKTYCSIRCNTDAGHARYENKVACGLINRSVDKRDRRQERKERYHGDVNFRLSIVLRTRLNAALQNNQKAGSAIRDLGCSIEEFKKHLESKFQPGMTWDNHSKTGWHIDHIIPLASFDLTDREQFLTACHYTNQQPLWAPDNHMKSDNIVDNIGKKIYILAGPSGCGKSTAAASLTHLFNVIDYDKHSFKKCIELSLEQSSKPNLIVTPIQAKRMKRELEIYGIQTTLIYLRESKDVILSRINSRGGKITATIDRRIARYEALNKKGLFTFSGTWDEVYSWLLAN